jgi:YgiT-type zinc finger domain-containing protein
VLHACTTCGQRRVSRQQVNVALRNGRTVQVPAEVCAACGEQYFDLDAMRSIEAAAGLDRPPRKRP